MPSDPARLADTREWLRKANEDLQAARRLLRPPRRLSNVAAFHCQQAIEKTLKAFLAWHDVPFRKTHDLATIGEACVEIDASLKNLPDRVAPLTEYAWKFRYPGEPATASHEEVQSALALAGELYKEILARMPIGAKRGDTSK